jgi:histidyl-tRNA synthetase
MTFQGVKGTRDFYPEQMRERKKMFDLLRDIAKKYGFKEVEAPAIENFELIKAKSGEEIAQQMFMIEKRSDERIALRAELTPSMTRMFINKQKEIPKPVKWFCISRMWRYEAPQKGRLREFYQFDLETFGSDKPIADAEIIALAIDSLNSLGLKKEDIVIAISNRELLQGLLDNNNIKEIEKTMRIIDKKNKITEDEFKQELNYLNKQQFDSIIKFLNAETLDEVENLLNEKGKKALQDLKEVFSLLNIMGKSEYIKFSPEIARGLAYYTGTVFECFDRKKEFRAILGGGRYNNMIEQFGGQPCPATGFAMGDVVIELVLKKKKMWSEANEGVDYYIAPVNKEYINKSIEIANKLRLQNSVEIDLMNRKLAKQFSYADSIKAKKVVIVGDETKEGKVKIKELKSGKEQEIEIEKI